MGVPAWLGWGPRGPREVSSSPVPAVPSWVPQGCRAPAGWQRWHWGCRGAVCSPRGWQRWVEAERAHPGRVKHLHPACSAWCSPRFWLQQGSDPGLWQPRTSPGSFLLCWLGKHISASAGCWWLAEPSRPRSFTSHQDRGPQAHPGTGSTGSTGEAGSSHEGRAWSRIPGEPCPACLDVPVLLRAGEGRAGAGGSGVGTGGL